MKKIYKKILVPIIALSIGSSIVLSKQESTTAYKNTNAYDGKFNMTYLYGGNSQTYLKNVDSTQNSLSMVSPGYFDINSDGSLKIVNIDADFIKDMHDRGIKVKPFLSNHWDRELGRTALRNRQALAEEIVQAIKKYNLDGVNVDIENVTEVDKDNFTDLVRILRQKLPEGKEVSVAVAANPRGFKTGWHGSYDYENLAKYSDYLIVMTYDESYRGSEPGPVASYSFVENSIKHLLNKGISSQKLVIGIPFYGRYWNDSDSNLRGNSLQQTTAHNLVEKYNADIIFDEEKKSPVFNFTITEDGPQATIAWTQLTPGNYTVWFENNESIKAKLEIVSKYNLKGAGSWRLGQEDKDIWNYYSLWLNDKYFKDIIQHWAENEIVHSIKQGWMKGVSYNSFAPNAQMTRAQAATILVRSMNLESHEVSLNKEFNDVSTSHWAYKYIQIAKDKGLVEGFEDNTFAPDKAITREEVAALINRLLKTNNIDIDIDEENVNYIDVASDRWSYIDVVNTTKIGVFKGFEDGTFKPTNYMTRGEVSAIMYRIDNELGGL